VKDPDDSDSQHTYRAHDVAEIHRRLASQIRVQPKRSLATAPNQISGSPPAALGFEMFYEHFPALDD